MRVNNSSGDNSVEASRTTLRNLPCGGPPTASFSRKDEMRVTLILFLGNSAMANWMYSSLLPRFEPNPKNTSAIFCHPREGGDPDLQLDSRLRGNDSRRIVKGFFPDGRRLRSNVLWEPLTSCG